MADDIHRRGREAYRQLRYCVRHFGPETLVESPIFATLWMDLTLMRRFTFYWQWLVLQDMLLDRSVVDTGEDDDEEEFRYNLSTDGIHYVTGPTTQ